MNDRDGINEVYSHYFPSENATARAWVEVSRLPKNMNIEVAVIAEKL